MSKRKFILQGLTSNTHVDAIRRIFDIPDLQQIILSVAFVNEEGVILLENEIRTAGSKTKVFSGIRNDITSLQGLARLISLGATVYAVDTGARNIIFHPKIYLAKGLNEARLVIGSANLTLGGLNNNIEAGMAMDFDLNDISEKELVESIENEFLSLPSRDPEHITLLTSEEQLEFLRQNGRILDEAEVSPPRPGGLPTIASKLAGLFFSSLIDQPRKSVFFISACEKSLWVTFLRIKLSNLLHFSP